MATEKSAAPARKPLWTYLAGIVAVFMISMDNLVVTNALPVISAKLHTGLEGLEWTVNGYTLTFAVLMLTGAALGDRYGRRRMFAVGMSVFTLSSAAAALAPSIGVLIAARAVQGAGAAIVMPLSITLIASVTPLSKRGLALGLWSATAGLGAALGPVIGGAVTQAGSWQWIFWINVPIGLLLLSLLWLVTESRSGAGRLDPLGVVLITGGLFGVVFGLVRGNGHGWTSPQVLGSLIGGGLLLAAFVAWEARAATPMLPLSLYRNRGFASMNASMLVTVTGMFGMIFLFAQYLQLVRGYSPLGAGVRALPWTASPAVSAVVAGLLAKRVGGRQLIAAGAALQAIGIGLLAVQTSATVPYPQLIPAFVIAGTGIGVFFAPITRLTLGFAPAELEGVASGTSAALRQLGTVIGVAVLGAVFSAHGGLGSPAEFIRGLDATLAVSAIILGASVFLPLLAPDPERQARTAMAPEAATAPQPARAAASG